MAVLLPDTQLGVMRALPEVRDGHGYPVPDGWAPLGPTWPGRARDTGDGTWMLALDLAADPVKVGDLVAEPGDLGRQWLALDVHVARNSADPVADYIIVNGRIRDAAGNTVTHLDGPADG